MFTNYEKIWFDSELVNECSDSNLNTCDPAAICMDSALGYECLCNEGYLDLSKEPQIRPGRKCVKCRFFLLYFQNSIISSLTFALLWIAHLNKHEYVIYSSSVMSFSDSRFINYKRVELRNIMISKNDHYYKINWNFKKC